MSVTVADSASHPAVSEEVTFITLFIYDSYCVILLADSSNSLTTLRRLSRLVGEISVDASWLASLVGLSEFLLNLLVFIQLIY